MIVGAHSRDYPLQGWDKRRKKEERKTGHRRTQGEEGQDRKEQELIVMDARIVKLSDAQSKKLLRISCFH